MKNYALNYTELYGEDAAAPNSLFLDIVRMAARWVTTIVFATPATSPPFPDNSPAETDGEPLLIRSTRVISRGLRRGVRQIA
jgi:hypothetical protein